MLGIWFSQYLTKSCQISLYFTIYQRFSSYLPISHNLMISHWISPYLTKSHKISPNLIKSTSIKLNAVKSHHICVLKFSIHVPLIQYYRGTRFILLKNLLYFIFGIVTVTTIKPWCMSGLTWSMSKQDKLWPFCSNSLVLKIPTDGVSDLSHTGNMSICVCPSGTISQ